MKTTDPALPGMKTVKLGELLTDEQLKGVLAIINDPSLGVIPKTQRLKKYLGGFESELEAKGVVPDYLAYWLMALAEGARLRAAARPERTGL